MFGLDVFCLVIWLIVGLRNLISKRDVTRVDYYLVWIMLILNLGRVIVCR